MNFLAHLFLSGSSEDIMTGNFIADGVKGNKFKEYPSGIAAGIRLHRKIDDFTDHHPVVLHGVSRLSKDFGKYGAVIIDLYFDHFLASNWRNFSEVELKEFSAKCFKTLEHRLHLFPDKPRIMFYFMRKFNWLLSYQTVEGISKALTGLSHRTAFISNMEHAGDFLTNNYELFKSDFERFFPELKAFADQEILAA